MAGKEPGYGIGPWRQVTRNARFRLDVGETHNKTKPFCLIGVVVHLGVDLLWLLAFPKVVRVGFPVESHSASGPQEKSVSSPRWAPLLAGSGQRAQGLVGSGLTLPSTSSLYSPNNTGARR